MLTSQNGIEEASTDNNHAVCFFVQAAAFALFWGRKERTPMVNELFRWYETTALPIYNPGEAARGVKGKIPSNVADSPLCHLSVSDLHDADFRQLSLCEHEKYDNSECVHVNFFIVLKSLTLILLFSSSKMFSSFRSR